MKLSTLILIILSITKFSLAQNPKPISQTPFVIGSTDVIHSKVLSENRTLNIYLPEGYNKDSNTQYPVIYLLDGSADEDFIHIAGLVQFNSFEWVNQVPKSIVVGIANVDRRRDYTFPTNLKKDIQTNPTSGHSDKFIQFIETELFNYIDSNYKTNSNKTLIGQSLGGLLATEILLKKPTLFNQFIIVSPSLWWNNGSLLKTSSKLLDSTFSQPTKIYIGVGKEGLSPTEIPRVMEEDAKLLFDFIKSSKSSSITCHFDYLELENHASILHQAVLNAFRLLSQSEKKE
jgi:uncharacterized protein